MAHGDERLLANNNQMLQYNGIENEMDDGQVALPNLAPYITFNPQIIMYSSQPATKRLVLQAINRSIREVSI